MRNPRTAQISSFAAAETTRRALEDAVIEIQGAPATSMRVIAGVELANGVERPIAHKLGRAPLWVGPSAVRGAVTTGRIEEIRGDHNRDLIIVLKATDYGATVTVDVAVM